MTAASELNRPSFAPFSRVGRFMALSATLGTDASGRLVAGDVQAQTAQALANLRETAARAGVGLERAAKVNVFLKHASDFAAMNAVYAPLFATDPPARTTVVSALGHPDALVEIAMVLVAPGEPREVVHPAAWQRSPNPYSYAIRSGDTLFLAGLVSRRGADNSVVAGDMTVQTRAILDNAAELLQAAGMDFGDIVSSRVYITSAAGFGAMNDAYRVAFPSQPPARATVCVELMNPDLEVEITFVAVKDAARRIIGEAGSLPLSPGVLAGGRLYLSGMLGNTAATAGDVVAQTAEMMARIGRTLDAGGHTFGDVGEAFLYVTDIATREAVVAEMAKSFPSGLPAGLVIGTGLVAPDGLVELMVTAAK
jgi:enamine deaminase RidA (YjgF/YER057c/UK114 family)